MGHTVILEEDLDETDIGAVVRNAPKPESYDSSQNSIAPLLAVFKE